MRTSITDTDDGVNVTFVVIGDASELRRRAHGAIAGTYPLRPESRALAERVHATVYDSSDGLCLHIVPRDPAQLDSIRDAVRQVLDDVSAHGCD